MNLEWHEWVALILCLILLFAPAIGFWYAGHEKHNKKAERQTQEYYVATTDADDED